MTTADWYFPTQVRPQGPCDGRHLLRNRRDDLGPEDPLFGIYGNPNDGTYPHFADWRGR